MREETKRLIKLAAEGDREAMGRLVTENSGLIYGAVRRFVGRGEPDDLFQIGAIGLMKAVRRFDTGYGVELSTYAVPMIIGEIRRFLRDDGLIKVSRAYKDLARRAALVRESAGEIGLAELAEKVGTSVEELAQAMEAVRRPDSIDRSVADGEGKPMPLLDTLACEDDENELLTKIALRRAVEKLAPRERKIIILRYFRSKTQSEVAAELGLSQVQISRLEKKSLARLREEMGE